jgi:hypothetical protein
MLTTLLAIGNAVPSPVPSVVPTAAPSQPTAPPTTSSLINIGTSHDISHLNYQNNEDLSWLDPTTGISIVVIFIICEGLGLF